jgi:hypothetical protein
MIPSRRDFLRYTHLQYQDNLTPAEVKMNAYLVEKCLMMGFAVVVACTVGFYAADQIHHISDVLAKVTQVQR